MKTIIIIALISVLIYVAAKISYIAGKARGFSDCYKMTHGDSL